MKPLERRKIYSTKVYCYYEGEDIDDIAENNSYTRHLGKSFSDSHN